MSENLVVAAIPHSTRAATKQYCNFKGTLGNEQPDKWADTIGCLFLLILLVFRPRSVCLIFTALQDEENPALRFKSYGGIQIIGCSRWVSVTFRFNLFNQTLLLKGREGCLFDNYLLAVLVSFQHMYYSNKSLQVKMLI